MRHPVWDAPPLDVRDVMRRERAALCDLLDSLAPDEWTRPTACDQWAVHGIVAHLLHDDLRILSHGRDGFAAGWFTGPEDELAAWLGARNERFVEALSELSPPLLVELLRWTAPQVEETFDRVDTRTPDAGVSWAGLHDAAPGWLGRAREYTERFLHQQQIRDATGQPGLWTAEYVGALLDTFGWALVPVLPASSERVALRIDGVAPRVWCFERGDDGWRRGERDREGDPVILDRAAVAWLTSARGTPPPPGVPAAVGGARAIIV
jgi:uncharacterized protein (TIGR03083 family)